MTAAPKPTAMRKFTTALSALALALAGMTAAAAPARANDDVAKLLFGAATLFIIGKAISDANAQQNRPPVAQGHGRPYSPGYGQGGQHRPRPAVLPARCEIRIGRGQSYYGERCLQREGYNGRLPQQCATQIRTDRGTRIAYEATCLQNAANRR